MLESLAVMDNSLPMDLLQLTNSLKNSILPKKEIQDLPDFYYCPQCKRRLNAFEDTILIMPCHKALHAICKNCVLTFVEQINVICPLDGFTFQLSVKNLQCFNSQHSRAQIDIPVVPDAMLAAPVMQKALAAPGREKHPEYPGTNLPIFTLYPGQYLLDRFPSVLPTIDTPESNYNSSNRSWIINPENNQVEVVNFKVFENIKLTGVGIANPINPDVTATLTFIKIYVGNTAKGAPAFVETPNIPLVGGSNVLSYCNFATHFSVTSDTQYTIKLKILHPRAMLEPMMLYRGNPCGKREIWVGSDDMVWEFGDTQDVEEGELTTGKNILTGPILRFLYTD